MAKDKNDTTTQDAVTPQTQPFKIGYTYIVKSKLRNAAHMVFACSEAEAEALAKPELMKEHGTNFRITSIEKW